jgi:hypothetical protein
MIPMIGIVAPTPHDNEAINDLGAVTNSCTTPYETRRR